MKTTCAELTLARRRLARIRCLDKCIKAFQDNTSLPAGLSYIPRERQYKIGKTSKLRMFSFKKKSDVESSTDRNSSRTEVKPLIVFVSNVTSKDSDIKEEKPHILVTSGEELFDSMGHWARFLRYVKPPCVVDDLGYDEDTWVLLYSHQLSPDDNPILVPVADEGNITAHEVVYGTIPKTISTWEAVVEHSYALHTGPSPDIEPEDSEAMNKLCVSSHGWTLDHDEELAQFLSSHIQSTNEHLGSVKNYVEAIKVSSSSDEDEGPENLTDGDPDTYWESDGNQGEHCITLGMKKGTVIQQMIAVIDTTDDNYMPYRFVVKGGEPGAMKQLNDVMVDTSLYGLSDILVLEDQQEHHPVIEIWIKECKDDGIDTRIHGIKLKSTKERDLGLSIDLFSSEHMIRLPKLQSFETEVLYRRALILQRFVSLLDSVLPYIVPAWEYSVGSITSLGVVRQLLPLSKKRMHLIEKLLRESENGQRLSVKRLYINRRAAAEHKSDPSLDPAGKNSVFVQVYEGLKPRERTEKPLDYRWSARYDQWWECKFIGEGIIDQGGGFRDSLSDISEELCPSDADVNVALPFFIRSPNQNRADANVNQDVYIPNPSCKDTAKYEWIGKLMGACFRGKESLVLSLPSFVWKKLSQERATWKRDYVTVDNAEVRMIENMDEMSEEEFDAYFSMERTWTTVLSDGTLVPLKPDGADITVHYEQRHEYCELVQASRMSEMDKQIDAIRSGFLQVIPKAVVDLMTWQELEKRICGDPEISMEALKRTTHYEDLDDDDTQVKCMWEALATFSNGDRSRFLRFVTGRRRLPAPIYICMGKGVDCLPESSTCSNTLYLPSYSSSKIAGEKLKYASYNCIAIDTDMSPYDN